jgi:hypothetical protein
MRIVTILIWFFCAFGLSNTACADGDVFDQFFRYLEIKNRDIDPHLPGETIDYFKVASVSFTRISFSPARAASLFALFEPTRVKSGADPTLRISRRTRDFDREAKPTAC